MRLYEGAMLGAALALCTSAIGCEKEADGQLDQLLREANERIQVNPQDAEAHNSRGVVHMERGRYGEALRDFDKAIELSHGHVAYICNRGSTYYRMARFDEAKRDFDTVIQRKANPFLAGTAYQCRCEIHAMEGDVERAWADAKQCLMRGSAELPKLAKLLREQAEQGDDRHTAYYRLGMLSIGNANLRYLGDELVGRAQYDIEELDRAIEHFTKAIELKPDFTDALSMRAEAALAKRDYERARADVEQLKRLGSEDPSLLERLQKGIGRKE